MAIFKEIVTKAVIGKGKKYFKNSYTIDVDDKPTTVLGCWIINHQFTGYKTGEKIGVEGSFDANIWFSYDNDTKTKVVTKRVNYNDLFNVKTKADADLSSDTDIIVRSLKQPVCSKVGVGADDTIEFDIEKELGVEIIGETKVKITIEEDEEPWDEVEDELTSDVEEEINKVNDKFL